MSDDHRNLSALTLADFLGKERAEIAGLTNGMPPEVATPYFERIDAAIAEYDALTKRLEKARHLLMLVYRDPDKRDNPWFIGVERLFPEEFGG